MSEDKNSEKATEVVRVSKKNAVPEEGKPRAARQRARKASNADDFDDRTTWENVRWIIGAATILVGCFVIVSVISYFINWQNDYAVIYGIDTINPRLSNEAANLCGRHGAVIADMMVNRSLGLFGVFAPLVLVILGLHIISANRFVLMLRNIIWVALVSVLGSLTLGLLFDVQDNMFNSGWGGAFGIEISRQMRLYQGWVGSSIILCVGWILAIIIVHRNFVRNLGRAKDTTVERGGMVMRHVIERFHKEETYTYVDEEENSSEEDVQQEEVLSEPEQEPVQSEQEYVESGEDEVMPEPPKDEQEEEDETEDGATIEVVEYEDPVLSKLKHQPFDPDHTRGYKYPPVEFLIDYASPDAKVSDDEIRFNKKTIEEALGNFGIPVREMKATVGPTVTLYEIVQEAGVKISRIQGLENDIAQSLKAFKVRIIAPMPGRGTIGIEVPNRIKEVVSMRSCVLSERFQSSKADLPVVIGRTIQNENFTFDLAKMPHLLVAGATGQGKSVGLNAILTSLLYRMDPSQLKLVLIDPKTVEFSLYKKLERHFLAKMESEEEAIVTDPKKAVATLNSLCLLMEERLKKCAEVGVRNISEYNAKVRNHDVEETEIMPFVVVVIDEFADLIMTAKEVETPVMRLAQKARAIGIHLIVATQRPDVKVITGTIKANFPARIAFRVIQVQDSRTIIDQTGANLLIGRGDMLLSKDGDLTRIQCALVETDEVQKIVDFISKQPSPTGMAYMLADVNPEAGGSEGTDSMGSMSGEPVKYDKLFADIARDAVSSGQMSTSYIQRNYEVGFNRAGRIMTQLERAGIVGPQQGAKPREIKFYDLPSLEAKLQELGVF